jgi:hypothetical protein
MHKKLLVGDRCASFDGLVVVTVPSNLVFIRTFTETSLRAGIGTDDVSYFSEFSGFVCQRVF